MADPGKRLRGARTVVASGQLSVDRDRAREKMRMFRLPDPHQYVLQFVQTASILGASRVDFAVAPSGTLCTFDAVFPHDMLGDIWKRALSRRGLYGGRGPID